MDFKRNIFESSARMPAKNESVASLMVPQEAPYEMANLSGHVKTEQNVRHAPCPRIGEK